MDFDYHTSKQWLPDPILVDPSFFVFMCFFPLQLLGSPSDSTVRRFERTALARGQRRTWTAECAVAGDLRPWQVLKPMVPQIGVAAAVRLDRKPESPESKRAAPRRMTK